jgi:iron complex transport system substrate-binding protein
MAAPPPDIISLLPAATEIVCALGAAARLAGVSHQCDHPACVTRLPVVTRSHMAGAATGAAIHQRVRDIIERGLALYTVDADKLREISPAVVVTQTQCHVCAASPEDLNRALEEWTGAAPQVVSLEALTLEGVLDDILAVGSALGPDAEARVLTDRIRQRIDDIRRRAAQCRTAPRVGVLEWLSPLMAGGNWMPEMLRIAGCEPVWGREGAHSPWLSEERLRFDDPDLLLVIPCGYDIAQTRAEIGALARLDSWPNLRAVRSGNVYICDGNSHFNRPGPRIAESLDIIFDIAHGGGARNAANGYCWVRMN